MSHTPPTPPAPKRYDPPSQWRAYQPPATPYDRVPRATRRGPRQRTMREFRAFQGTPEDPIRLDDSDDDAADANAVGVAEEEDQQRVAHSSPVRHHDHPPTPAPVAPGPNSLHSLHSSVVNDLEDDAADDDDTPGTRNTLEEEDDDNDDSVREEMNERNDEQESDECPTPSVPRCCPSPSPSPFGASTPSASAPCARAVPNLRESLSQHVKQAQNPKSLLTFISTLHESLMEATDKLNHLQTSQEDERLCVVCMEHIRTMAFTKCGHLCTCDVCSSTLRICPLCYTEGPTMRIY